MFKTREILKSAKENVKNNFWVFFFAVLIYYIIFGIVEGSIGSFSLINEMITNIRSGNFVKEVFLNPESEMYVTAFTNPINTIINFISLPIVIFLINPLVVGLSGIFIKGTEEKVQLSGLFLPFKKGYKKILATTFIEYVLITIIALFLTTAMSFAMLVMIMFFYFAINNIVAYTYLLEIILFVIIFVIMIAYVFVMLYIGYTFSMIKYIISENPDIHFSKAYMMSREMTKKRKLKLFKVDICYGIVEFLVALIPFILIGIGLAKLVADLGGMLWFVVGLYSFIPVAIIALLVEVYKRAAWANMYKKLKKDDTDFFAEDIYKAPEVHDEIKYENDEEKRDL